MIRGTKNTNILYISDTENHKNISFINNKCVYFKCVVRLTVSHTRTRTKICQKITDLIVNALE